MIQDDALIVRVHSHFSTSPSFRNATLDQYNILWSDDDNARCKFQSNTQYNLHEKDCTCSKSDFILLDTQIPMKHTLSLFNLKKKRFILLWWQILSCNWSERCCWYVMCKEDDWSQKKSDNEQSSISSPCRSSRRWDLKVSIFYTKSSIDSVLSYNHSFSFCS